MTTTAEITTVVERITPALAEEYLAVNAKNRKLTKKVERFANAMARGEWKLNGEAIKFDYNGNLIDGQHRLRALLRAVFETDRELMFDTLVVRGLPPETQLTMDQGATRKFSDALRWRGEKDVARLASAIRVLDNFLKIGVISTQQHKGSVTYEELFEVLDAHPGIRDLNPPKGDRNSKLLTKSIASVMWYLFRRVNEEDAHEFFYLLGGGEGESGVTITYLRNKLQDNATRTHNKMDTRHLSAFTIKAYNSYRSGSELKQIRWTGGGANPEPYPRINDLDIGPYG